jgi:hypothetical protein
MTGRQTDNRQTDIFELTPIHMGNFNLFFIFFHMGGRELMGWNLYILARFACRGINTNVFFSKNMIGARFQLNYNYNAQQKQRIQINVLLWKVFWLNNKYERLMKLNRSGMNKKAHTYKQEQISMKQTFGLKYKFS